MSDVTDTPTVKPSIFARLKSWFTSAKDTVVKAWDATAAAANKRFVSWRVLVKSYSMYVFAAITVAPELYDTITSLLASLGAMSEGGTVLLPEAFTKFLRTLGIIGMVVRSIKQAKTLIDEAAKKAAEEAAIAEAVKKALAEAGAAREALIVHDVTGAGPVTAT